MTEEKILVIGANGQVGTELVLKLREFFEDEMVIASDISAPGEELSLSGPFLYLDALDKESIRHTLQQHGITQVYHLAATLSAMAENKPDFAWRLNMESLLIALDLAKEGLYKRLFWPSSIAVFGPSTPKSNTPQHTIMDPDTVYGISKLAGERWCEYYWKKYGIDVRSLRYPGLISYKTQPGGGTTDYAVHIFIEALKKHSYSCFLSENTGLPMLYMPDAVKATIKLMHAPLDQVKIRSSYNLAGFSITPAKIASEIQKHIPDFKINYKSDYRQQIADSWPTSINDQEARQDWGWHPDYSMEEMVSDMLENIKETKGKAQ
ncbi:MAG: NAD-dependent epimerase/dehydratase family protein [Bacteroidia bacterium]